MSAKKSKDQVARKIQKTKKKLIPEVKIPPKQTNPIKKNDDHGNKGFVRANYRK